MSSYLRTLLPRLEEAAEMADEIDKTELAAQLREMAPLIIEILRPVLYQVLGHGITPDYEIAAGTARANKIELVEAYGHIGSISTVPKSYLVGKS